MGYIEKQETEMLKWKLEMELETKTHQITGAVFLHRLMISVLCHYYCYLPSNHGYMTGFMSHVLWLYSCTVTYLV